MDNSTERLTFEQFCKNYPHLSEAEALDKYRKYLLELQKNQ